MQFLVLLRSIVSLFVPPIVFWASARALRPILRIVVDCGDVYVCGETDVEPFNFYTCIVFANQELRPVYAKIGRKERNVEWFFTRIV
jgi:hypothetical protein